MPKNDIDHPSSIRIEAYDRDAEFVIWELSIQPIKRGALRELAGFPEDFDLPVGGIELEEKHLLRIREWIDRVLDYKKYHVIFDEGEAHSYYRIE